jgi:hypothetical protein
MGFKVYEATTPEVADIAKKLPLGRLYAHRSGIALMSPPADEAKPEGQLDLA